MNRKQDFEKEAKLNKTKILELIDDYRNVKNEIKQLEREEAVIREKLKYVMNKYDLDELRGSTHSIHRNTMSRLQISRKDLPSDIFEKYAVEKEIEYIVIRKRKMAKEE